MSNILIYGATGYSGRLIAKQASSLRLEPILAGYGQSLVRERDAEGRETGAIAHVLRVFLIDPQQRIRNIYSSGYLDPELLAADVESLVLEQGLRRELGPAADR